MEGKESRFEISVVENENRRELPISHYPREVAQLCKDISNFFKEFAESCSDYDEEKLDLEAERNSVLRRAPNVLRCLYSILKVPPSRVWIYEYKLINIEEMEDCFEGIFEESELIPFARNIEGCVLACGADDHSGGVYEIDEDEKEFVCKSLATYLESYRDLLLSNKLEYIEGMGMIQRSEDKKPK